MALLSFLEFSSYIFEKSDKFLGCDVGEKTIGLAISDRNKIIATPFRVLHRTQWKKDGPLLLKIIEDENIGGIVVGFPLNMNGTEGPRCQSTRQFVANLLALREIPVCLWDERLSTSAVTRTLLEADLSRQKRADVVDKMAAAYILQGFLEGFRKVHSPL